MSPITDVPAGNADACTLDPGDVERFASEVKATPAGAAGLVELYLLSSTRRLQTLRQATEEADLSRIRSEAGILAGASRRLGARRLASLCNELLESPAADIPAWLASLESEHAKVRTTLQAFYLQTSSPLPS